MPVDGLLDMPVCDCLFSYVHGFYGHSRKLLDLLP